MSIVKKTVLGKTHFEGASFAIAEAAADCFIEGKVYLFTQNGETHQITAVFEQEDGGWTLVVDDAIRLNSQVADA